MRNTSRRRSRDDLPNLPGDIVDDILLMLPAKSVCRFRCVCKHWCKLFNNPDFAESRLKRSIKREKLNCLSIEDINDDGAQEFYKHITESSSLCRVFENNLCEYVKLDSPCQDKSLKIDIVGYKGLILIKSRGYPTRHQLWNPYTRDFKEFPIPEDTFGPDYYHKSYAYGVGYNCDPDDYKIIRVAHYYGSDIYNGCKIQVYKLESNSWKTLPDIFPYRFINTFGRAEVIVFVYGAFHWIARCHQSQKICIVSLDIHGEKLNEVAVTPPVDELLNLRQYSQLSLGLLGGRLCILLIRECYSRNIEIWVKKDCNVTESWSKLFVVQLPVFADPICYMKVLWEFKNGEVLFLTTWGSYSKCYLVLYDPVSQKCQIAKIQHIIKRKEWNIEAYGERASPALQQWLIRKELNMDHHGY